MTIDFSRHAKRRMHLYKIEEEDVRHTIKAAVIRKGLTSGKHEEVNRDLSKKYGYPLKVVFTIKNHLIEVITAYPLRKEKAR